MIPNRCYNGKNKHYVAIVPWFLLLGSRSRHWSIDLAIQSIRLTRKLGGTNVRQSLMFIRLLQFSWLSKVDLHQWCQYCAPSILLVNVWCRILERSVNLSQFICTFLAHDHLPCPKASSPLSHPSKAWLSRGNTYLWSKGWCRAPSYAWLSTAPCWDPCTVERDPSHW